MFKTGTIFPFICSEITMKTNSKLVYSTDESFFMEAEGPEIAAIDAVHQRVRIHLDRKGGGKIVSVVKGLEEPLKTLSALAKDLKKGCGVGGSVKNGEILVQGNHREKIQKILEKKGYNAKLSGG